MKKVKNKNKYKSPFIFGVRLSVHGWDSKETTKRHIFFYFEIKRVI